MMSGQGSVVGAGWRGLFLPSFSGHLLQARHGWGWGSTDLFCLGCFSPHMLPGHGVGVSTFSPVAVPVPALHLGTAILQQVI